MYKHYSFDLWLTLIRSNPSFKKQRSVFFHQHFNSQSKSLEEVESIFRQVDIMCNLVNERTGKNIDADEMYLMVIAGINDNKLSLTDVDTDVLYSRMETLLFEHLPVLYCDNTKEVLQALRQIPGVGISLLSNTGFIKGSTLRKVLQVLGIDSYFNFQLYSDEAGLSKPNTRFFDMMLEEARAIQPLQLHEIIHVGDNPNADIQGAETAGIDSCLIHSNNIPITQILNYVSRKILVA